MNADILFAGPNHSITARGGEPVSAPDIGALAEVLAGAPFAIGAVAYSGPATLIHPESVRHGARPADTGTTYHAGSPLWTHSLPDAAAHRKAVADIVARVRAGELHKAVLARALELEFGTDLDTAGIVANLLRNNAYGYVFAVPVRAGGQFLGASPELLLERRGARARSHPLAGSAPRDPDPVRDRENAELLRKSAKDSAEHAFVVEAIAEILSPYCARLDVPARPELFATPDMWHLGTEITGTLRDREASSLHLAAALHPTPAVCGSPREQARTVLAETEPFDRGHYAGIVGWCAENGDGEWAIGIRSAEVTGSRIRLHAGGGIVADSDPEAELAETNAKFRTMLRAICPDWREEQPT